MYLIAFSLTTDQYIARRTYIFIDFAILYRRFIQDFSRIATSPTAMLKTTGSSIAFAFRVDDDEVVGGGGAGAESCESVC